LDPNTLTLYTVAAGLSFSLSLVMVVFAYFQPDTRLIRSWAVAILVLAGGFFVSGIGPALPRWMTVIGTNMALLSAGPILYSGFAAYYEQREPLADRRGWAMVLLTAPAFWYWGLIEPNGNYRSVVFSLAIALTNLRTAWLLAGAAWRRVGGLPTWLLAILFGVAVAWMTARAGLLLVAEAPPANLRSANPTTWITVFWYIVLVSTMSVCAMWMEVSRYATAQQTASGSRGGAFGFIAYFHNKLFLLGSGVIVLIVGIAGVLGIAYANFHESEKARLIRTAELTNKAFVEQTIQVAGQIDTMLHLVRAFHQRSQSVAATNAYIESLNFDRSVIDNIYLISAAGVIIIAHDPAALGRSVTDRAYFPFHRDAPEDRIFISPVESGRVTGKFHFRITRRINNPDGSFGGLVLATVVPESFARHYRDFAIDAQNSAALLGTADHKLRARTPEPAAELWAKPVESPLWDALKRAPAGRYENISGVDGVLRTFVYERVANLPLVMVNGFSDNDLKNNIHGRMRWLIATTFIILCFTLLLALLLTIEAKRRDEQDRFMSMLSHELKTPMSVIRMALGIEGIPATIRDRIARAVGSMNAVIERCLQADKLRYGHVQPAPSPCRIADILDDLRAASAAPERLSIQMEDLPSLDTDVQLLRIILSNLIDNAVKYGVARGTVSIRGVLALHKKRPGIRIDIANRPGQAGMPDPRQVFGKYYRAPGAHGKTGSGLGLHISSGFAEKIGGWLRYRPTPDEVKFELWLPL